ncbi:hypothetical protein LIER_35385 [Lithospermum erythrorhizon]|uniref:Calcium uniporter protein C-terminal domain-containing protein n=1 Tax=Lithospermum erythrorhizon TaxID=34254 RepID=A0AAV3NUH6_LITER
MFRTSYNLLKHTLNSTTASPPRLITTTSFRRYCSSATLGGGGGIKNDEMSNSEAKRLMRLVNVEELKKKLGMDNREVIKYGELLEACKKMGLAKTHSEATDFSRILDDAGVVLLFRDKVYLHPDKVVDLVRKAVPLSLLPEDDPNQDEMKQLHEKMEEIDMLAHKQVRRILWTGLGLSVIQVGLFFRLTFWEFSWDVMEPIAFFATATGILIGYAYFLFTSRDPTYQDFMKRLFLSRQRKLIKMHNFDVQRFVELHKRCKSPQVMNACVRKLTGIEVKPEDLLRGQ